MTAPADWKTLEELAAGIDDNRPPSTDNLAEHGLDVSFEDGSRLELRLVDHSTVRWRATNGVLGTGENTDRYEAVKVDDNTFFIETWFHNLVHTSLTLIVNTHTARVLAAYSIIAETPVDDEPRVEQRFVTGVLDRATPPSGPEPGATRDLLGKRILNVYGPNHVYEHTYLNSGRYCWQCLRGVQRGHGDCDLASYYKFDENRYVFTFREFRIPVATVFFFNMDTMFSTGKFFGLSSTGEVEHSWGGAYMSLLSQATYPEDTQPA